MKDPNFERLFADVAKWQAATFPGQTLEGKITHLKKELIELAAKPRDPSEQADVLILAVGVIALCRVQGGVAGVVPSSSVAREVLTAAHSKMEINKLRKWIDQGDGTWAHDKEQTP